MQNNLLKNVKKTNDVLVVPNICDPSRMKLQKSVDHTMLALVFLHLFKKHAENLLIFYA